MSTWTQVNLMTVVCVAFAALAQQQLSDLAGRHHERDVIAAEAFGVSR